MILPKENFKGLHCFSQKGTTCLWLLHPQVIARNFKLAVRSEVVDFISCGFSELMERLNNFVLGLIEAKLRLPKTLQEL